MINWALRYQTIISKLNHLQPEQVLDVGSGPEGLRLFWNGPVVGVDWVFKRRPLHKGVLASTMALPFRDRSFPAVVSSDILEHIPPGLRQAALDEWLRVCDDNLLLTFPSGPAAAQAYAWLAERMRSCPNWLNEHLQNGLPEATEIESYLSAKGWQVETCWLEDAMTHARLVYWEETLPGKLLGYSLCRVFGRWLVPHLPMPAGRPLRVLLHARRQGWASLLTEGGK